MMILCVKSFEQMGLLLFESLLKVLPPFSLGQLEIELEHFREK